MYSGYYEKIELGIDTTEDEYESSSKLFPSFSSSLPPVLQDFVMLVGFAEDEGPKPMVFMFYYQIMFDRDLLLVNNISICYYNFILFCYLPCLLLCVFIIIHSPPIFLFFILSNYCNVYMLINYYWYYKIIITMEWTISLLIPCLCDCKFA